MKYIQIYKQSVWILFALLPGCGGETQPDSTTLPSYCNPEPPLLEVGTGRNEFIELTKNTIIKIETGPQGGSHLWISVRTRALGTSALLEFGVNDGQTGELLTWEGLKLVMPLNQGPEGGEAHGLSAFLNEKDPAKNAGKTVVLWATATGDCHPPMHSESPPIVLQ